MVNFREKILTLFLVLVFLSSCISGGQKRTRKAIDSATQNPEDLLNNNDDSDSGQNEFPQDEGIIGSGEESTVVSEIRSIVDPIDGTYKTKITIPKNMSGMLYLGGIGISALSSKIVKVRFKFGKSLEPIELTATIGKAPGITPSTDVEVLQLDLSEKPFEAVRLLYDLYDYKEYEADSDSVLYDNRDDNLYCRGLALQYDSTFSGNDTNNLCDAAGEVCRYAYAKVVDKGYNYVSNSVELSVVPQYPAIAHNTSGLDTDTDEIKSKRCLEDSITGYNTTTTLSSVSYTNKGPFRAITSSIWDVSSSALYGTPIAGVKPSALFVSTLSGTDPDYGYGSYLFPRAGKVSLSTGIEYMGSTNALSALLNAGKSAQSLSTDGDTNWISGCSYRTLYHDSINNEGIGSCTITAVIELVALDPDTQVETVVKDINGGSAIGVKLQLVRPSTKDNEGKEVIYSSYKACNNNSSVCGADECCYNERCWSKSLVSQCMEESNSTGNLAVGESCSTDYSCASLCCNRATGKCAVHDNVNADPPVLCSKPPGDTCVSKEYCRKENIQTCNIYKTTVDNQGNQLCARRCYNNQVHGTCQNGICVPPPQPSNVDFDVNNPDCSSALDPPIVTSG